MRRLALTLVPLLLLACDRAPVAPDVAPSFDIDNAPDFTGIVVRGADPAGQTWGDPAKGLRVAIGFDPVDRCANPDSYTDYDIVIWADKWLSSGRDVSLNKFKDARIAVERRLAPVRVTGNANQLQQVVVNLVVNGVQSIGGRR